MRHTLSLTTAALMISGAAVLSVAPAFAGADEASRDSFWAHQSVGGTSGSHGQYMKMDPRDEKADDSASAGVDASDASNPYFNHAMGTMNGPDAVAQAAPSSNGQYTATYHQPYMQVEPRDQKVDKGDGSQDDNIYYYHAEGTMAHP